MYSNTEIATMRDLFYVEKEILIMEFKEMIQKTKIVEQLLKNEIRSQRSETDFYVPTHDFEEPPKKRIKK